MKTTIEIADVQHRTKDDHGKLGDWTTVIKDGVITEHGVVFCKVWNWREGETGGKKENAEAFPYSSERSRVVFKGKARIEDGKVVIS